MFKKGKRMKRSDKTEQLEKFNNLITENRKKVIIISLILFIYAIIGVMYAFFTDVVKITTPVITSGSVSVQLQEDAPFDTDIPEDGADTTIKTFRAISTGNVDCYVRSKIIPMIEYYDTQEEAWMVANIPISDIELTITASNWIESSGYYYYKYVLAPEEISSDFTVEITNINIPDDLKEGKIRATIKVILESAQYDYDAWKDIFNISELPQGVEEGIIPDNWKGSIYEIRDGVPIPKGFYYVGGTRNTGLVISDSPLDENVGDSHAIAQNLVGNQFVWIPVDGENVKYEKWDSSVTSVLHSETSLTGITLPNGVSSEEYQVETYGGFYIARYEAGIPDSLPQAQVVGSSDTRNVVGIPISKNNSIPWNYINYPNSKTNAESMYSSEYVQSGIMTGTMWDAAIKWLENSGYNVQTDSTSWGNYRNAAVTNITEYSTDSGASWITTENRTKGTSSNWLLKTGHSEYTKANNIYDLAGNMRERTAERCGEPSFYVVMRGNRVDRFWNRWTSRFKECYC